MCDLVCFASSSFSSSSKSLLVNVFVLIEINKMLELHTLYMYKKKNKYYISNLIN